MSYAAVHTFTVGEVATAANLNNLGGDITALLSLSATVDTTETTTSTTYADLTTVGPAITVNTGDRTEVNVVVSAQIQNNTASDGAKMSVAVSGATTLAASDVNGILVKMPGVTGMVAQLSFDSKITGLTAGSNTFTAKYAAVTGGTATFLHRWLVIGL